MDKENGKGNSKGNSGSGKLSNSQEPDSILDAASLFGAYWPRGDVAANMFAGFGMPAHQSMQYGMLPPGAGGAGGGGSGGGGGRAAQQQAPPPAYPATTGASAAVAAAAAYSNAYNNTLSVAASQAASLGIPAASAAWWSMASHLAAQDYLARLQASGLSFPGLPANPAATAADLQYSAALAAAGLPSLAAASAGGGHHGGKAKGGKGAASSLSRSQNHSSSKSSSSSHHHKSDHARLSELCKTTPSIPSSRHSSISSSSTSSHSPSPLSKYSQSVPGLSIQPATKSHHQHHHQQQQQHHHQQQQRSRPPSNEMSYLGKGGSKGGSPGLRESGSASPGVFSNPLGLVGGLGVEKQDGGGQVAAAAAAAAAGGLSSSILRLPPDTEIIKYTSSIVGPKIPGTTNRGRKKTISLDPPSVSLHPSTGLMVERSSKRAKLNEQDPSPPPTPTAPNDRVEVIKLPATNGSPTGGGGGGGDSPLNLSLKPGGCGATSSLTSLSNMSASIGADRISRRKPGPKPRRCIPAAQLASPPLPPASPAVAAPSASLAQLFARADSPRPPSRNEGSDGGSSTSSASTSAAQGGGGGAGASAPTAHGNKEGRPRNLGRGVSKPKKNTVASLLAQSRALGIKPVPMLDPNISMNQQMNLLKSNILAAQQYLSETSGGGGGGAGGVATAADEKALNKFIQEKLRGALSDSSTVDATSDSDNLTDSNHTDSEMEAEMAAATTAMGAAAKKQKHYDERLLRVPLEKGWKRETVIRGLTKSGGLRGDVSYSAPDSSNKFKQMSDVTQYLEYQKSADLCKDHFTFSCRCIIGDYLQPVPPEMQAEGGEFIHLSEEDVIRRLEELKSAMRTSLPVEQRIEMARKQQAARAAARLDREQARIHKEIERSERQEQARREREARSQQMMEEREMKRQQAAILKEQMYIQEITKQREMLYTVELERERRRQHMALVKSLETRRKLEERERKKQQLLAEKQAGRERRLEQRRADLEILTEIRRPCDDLELEEAASTPEYARVPGVRLAGRAFADALTVFEFLHNFGETLGFDMESLPTLAALQSALLPDGRSHEAEDELFSVMTHLLVCAIEDPGIPNPARYTTMLGQSLRQADITPTNISEILRIYLYANATGEVKALTGVHFERDREKRIPDHHQTDDEMSITRAGKNSTYYEVLHSNPTFKLSDLLKHKPYMSLSPTIKVEILAFICNELLQNKAVIRQIESSLENCAQQKKEKWLLDMKIRKLKMLHNRKVRTEAMEKAQVKMDGDDSAAESPSLHKDDLLDEEENEMSENESVGTQPEEEEDNKLSGEELGKKLEKLVKTSETHMQTLNTASLQLRAICFGQDRYFRRYWSLPKAGGIFVEAMESADPEQFEEQARLDAADATSTTNGVSCLDDVDDIRDGLDEIDDADDDKEVSSLVGSGEKASDNHPDHPANHVTDHRKTPNRLADLVENGVPAEDNKSDHNLAELKRSVDDMVQSLERNLEFEKANHQMVKQEVGEVVGEEGDGDRGRETPFGSKKFNLFERLGQCMERENKSEEDLKAEVGAEVKEELKNEILNELKSEIKTELIKLEPAEGGDADAEHRWFGILPTDGATCDGVCLTAGNKWENGGVGACTRDITELKIPVFPPPSSNSSGNYHNSCDSPAPLQMTADESAQLEHIKKHGMPRPSEKKRVPKDKRYGWWRITDPAHLRQALEALQTRGARERELKRSFAGVMQSMYEHGGGIGGGQLLRVEPGRPELIDLLGGDAGGGDVEMEGDAPRPDGPDEWRPDVARRVDMFLLEQVEALEDKVASASMQVKGWKIPNRDVGEIPYKQIVTVAKERLAFLELNIERRYLKPPLGINTGDPNLAAMSQDPAATSASSGTAPSGQASPGGGGADADVPKGLVTWRDAINRCSTSAQLAMCLYALEASIAWDKSIMKANCQFCHSGDNEDKLLLCDGCDKGYHTYCFKPKMDNIPDGDWYCHECMNKATGERNCIVCGRKASPTSARLVPCELCPRAYHTDCHQPALPKSPRGKWYCSNCIAKKPHKKTPVKKNHKAVVKEGELMAVADHPPASPAPSHCSTATNEDLSVASCCAQSDISNSSLANVSSPSSVSLPPCPTTPNAGAASVSAAAAAAHTANQNLKKEKANAKRLMRELAPCRAVMEDLECHDDAWPFLLPVNTKQFPTYKKIIKQPMDLSTIKKRLLDMQYKSRDEFCIDVRQIFNNCETFNEDDSPVGKAGHCMRQFFEQRWTELCTQHQAS